MSKVTFTRTALMGAALALGLGASAPAMAAGHSNDQGHCAQGQKCQPQARSDNHKRAPQRTEKHADNHRSSAPRVGAKAHGERIAWSNKYHHLPKPRAHTHYERVDGRVVLVNNNTLAVVAVVGLATALLANN